MCLVAVWSFMCECGSLLSKGNFSILLLSLSVGPRLMLYTIWYLARVFSCRRILWNRVEYGLSIYGTHKKRKKKCSNATLFVVPANNYCFYTRMPFLHFWPFSHSKFVYRISGNKLRTEKLPLCTLSPERCICLCPLSTVYCVPLCVCVCMDAQETLFRKLNKQFHFPRIAPINYYENATETKTTTFCFFLQLQFQSNFVKGYRKNFIRIIYRRLY